MARHHTHTTAYWTLLSARLSQSNRPARLADTDPHYYAERNVATRLITDVEGDIRALIAQQMRS
ncbi:MAG: hypothetical protein ABJV68_02990 [Paracoccaceae bacterium]